MHFYQLLFKFSLPLKFRYLGDNYIQKFLLGRYIVGYTVGNYVWRRRVSGAVKRDFRTYIRRYTSPNEDFEYGYPHEHFPFHKDSENVLCCVYDRLPASLYSLVNQWKATLRNEVGFATVYRRIYCRKFMTLSNQTSRCICECISLVILTCFFKIISYEIKYCLFRFYLKLKKISVIEYIYNTE